MSTSIVSEFEKFYEKVDRPISLHEPIFLGNEKKYLEDCIDSGWVSYLGSYVTQFEKLLCERTGCKTTISTSSGTSALHLALILLGVERDDEVLVPALSFVGSVNPIAYVGAIPHFIDSESKSFGVDPDKLEEYLEESAELRDSGLVNKATGRRIRALVVTHIFGHPARMDRLRQVADRFQLKLIEDAAEAIGSTFQGKHVGGFGDFGVLSFNGNKVVTTGGGGALLTNDDGLGTRAKHLSTTAKKSHPWEFDHDEIGFNYRLPNLNAAVGVAQLEKLDAFLSTKRKLSKRYRELLSQMDGLEFIEEPKDCRSNYWLNAFTLEDSMVAKRDDLLAAFHEKKILVRPIWKLLSHLPMYRDCPRMNLDTSLDLQGRTICLPSSVSLGQQ